MRVGTRETPSLKRNTLSLAHVFGFALAGVLAAIAPIEVGPAIGAVGPAAIWPVILGYLLVALISIPIFEYTRIVPFAGGYYGLAELGYGLAAGKFTALANYIYSIFVQASNAAFASWLIIDTTYLIFNVLPPIWVWFLIAIVTLLISFALAILEVKNLGNVVFYSNIIMTIVVVIFAIYVIARSPYNSFYYLNPVNSIGGWSGLFFATAIVGYYFYTGYGSSLFYTEETKSATLITWIAIYLSLTFSAFVIAINAYSEVVAVPLKDLSAVASAPIPQLASWVYYVPTSALLILNILLALVSFIAFGGYGGSQARLLWAMARDNFIKSEWLKRLHLKRNVPVNAALLSLILSLIATFGIAGAVFAVYGYSADTVALVWPVTATIGSLTWYFHHFIPELGLWGFLRKHPEIKWSAFRKYVAGLIVPIAGIAFFTYTFYEGIISNLVEPYFAAVLVALISMAGAAIYVAYKARKGDLGESVVHYMLAEMGKLTGKGQDGGQSQGGEQGKGQGK